MSSAPVLLLELRKALRIILPHAPNQERDREKGRERESARARERERERERAREIDRERETERERLGSRGKPSTFVYRAG